MSKRSFYACSNPNHKGNTNTWFTPRTIIEPLGKFDLDPCSQSYRPFDTAWRIFCEDKDDDGLQLPWFGRVWLNPPYGRDIGKWLEKLAAHGNGIALVFARTETIWAQKAMAAATAINFLSGRISFIRADGRADTNAATGSMLLAYGGDNATAIEALPGKIAEVRA
jgi:hypothetical protein